MRLRTAIPVGLMLLLTAGAAQSANTPSGKASPSTGKSGAAAGSKSRVKKSGKRSRRRERGQKVPAPERISEIQQALAKDGAFSGTPNGKWDYATVEAMKKFQSSHGLNPSGKLDALTLQKLGLGSQTAGVAAPLPPVATSLITTKPPQTGQRQ